MRRSRVGFVGAEHRAERADADLVQDPKGPNAGGGANAAGSSLVILGRVEKM
jgi:hypothetical protein